MITITTTIKPPKELKFEEAKALIERDLLPFMNDLNRHGWDYVTTIEAEKKDEHY